MHIYIYIYDIYIYTIYNIYINYRPLTIARASKLTDHSHGLSRARRAYSSQPLTIIHLFFSYSTRDLYSEKMGMVTKIWDDSER